MHYLNYKKKQQKRLRSKVMEMYPEILGLSNHGAAHGTLRYINPEIAIVDDKLHVSNLFEEVISLHDQITGKMPDDGAPLDLVDFRNP